MLRTNYNERGDTLIEVLVAVTALALVVTVCYSVMTRGFAQGQVSLERTTTQGMVSGHIATLRDIFARHEQAKASGQPDPAEWTAIKGFLPDDIDPEQMDSQLSDAREACTLGARAAVGTGREFYFNSTATATATTPLVFNAANRQRVASSPTYGDGIWVEGYRVYTDSGPLSDARPYYIFFVKACWDASISGERQTMVTNVRLYEAYD